MTHNENAIQIEGLWYTYGSSRNAALENINLCIGGNEFTAIIGQNGSGKTTLLKNIMGLLRPSKGGIFIHGNNSREMTVSAVSARIGFVMQNPDSQLFADTVHAEIAFALKNARLAKDEIARRVEDALAAVELSDRRDAYPPALGRGERAKVVIASVIAMNPEIIIMDEPAGGQDYRGSVMIMEIAEALHRAGKTIIFVTHNMPLACRYAKRVIVMRNGHIEADGSPREIFDRAPETAYLLPPQIYTLSKELRAELPLEKNALSVSELGDMLLDISRNG